MSTLNTQDVEEHELELEDLPLKPGGVYRRALPNGAVAWCTVQGLVLDDRGRFTAEVHIPGYGTELLTNETLLKAQWTLVE